MLLPSQDINKRVAQIQPPRPAGLLAPCSDCYRIRCQGLVGRYIRSCNGRYGRACYVLRFAPLTVTPHPLAGLFPFLILVSDHFSSRVLIEFAGFHHIYTNSSANKKGRSGASVPLFRSMREEHFKSFCIV